MIGVLDSVKPGRWERRKVNNKVKKFLKFINKYLNELDVVVGGSFAKDTWLSGNHDIDIFVMFPYEKYKKSDLSRLLANRLSKYKLVHGSRDYFQIEYSGFLFELIPVLKINSSSKAVNVTDVSPLHTEWVNENIKEYSDDVRLAKLFAKCNNVYGAESYIKGFSGYLLEVLTIHYKGFFGLMKAVARWRDREFIDTLSHYKDRTDVISKLNRSKITSLIVIDPVQKNRNIAAAVSNEKYKEFIEVCKGFMRNPSNEFFKQKKVDLKFLKEKAGLSSVAFIESKVIPGKKDIIGCKVLKVFSYIQEQLARHEFKVSESGWEMDSKARLWYIIDSTELSETRKHYGPMLHDEENMTNFIKKWHDKDILDENGKAFVYVERKHRSPESLIKELLAKDYAQEVLVRPGVRVY